MRAPRHAVIAMMALARVRLTHRGQLSLLHELVPNAAVIALLVDLNVPEAVSQVSEVQAAARTLGLQLVVLNARTASDIDMAFASLMRERASALVVGAGGFFVSRRDQIIALAARHAIPAIYGFREYSADGGLVSYGNDIRMPFAERASIPGGCSKARNRLTFRSCDLPNSS
ncbi:MAG: ABC transporter substrate binding protein [Pseudolabrys sp.]